MTSPVRAFLLATSAAALLGAHGAPLRVIRSSPTGVSDGRGEITVSFDRPVAGSLERTVDPAKVLRIVPAMEGRYEWRDPVTVRFIPAKPLAADTRWTVTVGTDFEAMDGSRLAEPHVFAFRVRGPQVVAGRPVGPSNSSQHVSPAQRFELVVSDSVDANRFADAVMIEMAATCAPRVIRMRAGESRRVTTNDPYDFQGAYAYDRSRSSDTLRRVVSLFPRTPIPRNCNGTLVVPLELSSVAPAEPQRWGFKSYGPLTLTEAHCAGDWGCPRGPLTIHFSNPVSGAQVQRLVRTVPAVPFTVRDTAAVQSQWALEAAFVPRTTYAIVADTALRDVFGQRLTGNPAMAARTTGFEPYVTYPFGRQTVERVGFRTLPVEHVNADTLVALVAAVPTRMEGAFLTRGAWNTRDLWDSLSRGATVRRIPVKAGIDRGSLTGLQLPVPDATRPGTPTLLAVKVGASSMAKNDSSFGNATLSLVQVTDLGVTARIGVQEGAVWVTGVSDGKPRANALVTLHAADGTAIATARSDAAGLAILRDYKEPIIAADAELNEYSGDGEANYVSVTLGADRALVAVRDYDSDLGSWSFGIPSAWGAQRFPMAGAVFAERGIYRPGEPVYLKAIVRTGALGALRAPPRTDSLRWVLSDREGNDTFTRTVALSAFGSAQHTIQLPANAPVGTQRARVMLKRRGIWRTLASTSFRVGEYRPPEFLVEMAVRSAPTPPTNMLSVGVTARYLFGAPMARAQVNWEARSVPVSAWELDLPGTAGWTVGDMSWGEYERDEMPGGGMFASGIDTLDDGGDRALRVSIPPNTSGAALRVAVAAAVTDVNRQSVGGVASVLVHPADFYLAARSEGSTWFWRANEAQRIAVRALRPDGGEVADVRVTGQMVRRDWHRVRRERDGIAQMVGEWVTDTVGRCELTTRAGTLPTCDLTPRAGGVHTIEVRATDASGRTAVTRFSRWVSGEGFVPWSDETQFKMDLFADKDRYAVGDTATVLIASPFTDAEAWLTVEREGVIEQRRLRITSGSQMVKIPITERFVPNAYVSVVVVRGRSAPPGKLDDPGRPTMRVGYASLRVTPEVKRLAVGLTLGKPEYRPGDSAQVRVAVRDGRGVGARAEVTLWAVDEGVLALTGYKLPDPLDLLYQPRALGLRLASNLVAVTPQVAEGEKGQRAPGGGGGADAADVLRSQFKTTAFFLGDVLTDSLGDATVMAKLPDNLTTFRVMAVAITATDRVGSGQTPMLVTRPVVARPTLPRFVRPGDTLQAGTVVNRRDARAAQATVKASATGIRLLGAAERTLPLAVGKGSEARFRFAALANDSAAFRFDVRSGSDVDAIRVAVPVKPEHFPTAHVLAGTLQDTTTIAFKLPSGIDPERSRITITMGTTPMALVRGLRGELRVYPYECTEQVSSRLTPLLALMRVEGALTPAERTQARAEITRGVGILLGRQRPDGGIGYWSVSDWTTPWLTAYAARMIVDARDLGIPVDSGALARLTEYLQTALRDGQQGKTPLEQWYDRRATRLADQVAAVELLARLGAADRPAENELLRNAPQMLREDRIRFAEHLAGRGATADARRLLAPIWAQVRTEGRSASLAPDTTRWYFHSRVRETARLLSATLATDPANALVGPMVEWLVVSGRDPYQNTQDRSAAVMAMAAYDAKVRATVPRTITVRSGTRVVLRTASLSGDTVLAVGPLLGAVKDESRPLRLTFQAEGAATIPSFFHVTVTEVPLRPVQRPAEAGMRVERWYERYSDGKPVTSVVEGELVRVRLRLTVPASRRFVVLDDALPAGLEAVDLSLRTSTTVVGPGANVGREPGEEEEGEASEDYDAMGYGRWDSGWWSPWDFREIRDDRVVWSASWLWQGVWNVTYIARATTPGTYVLPPARAEEMYDPGVNGRSDGGRFTVTVKAP